MIETHRDEALQSLSADKKLSSLEEFVQKIPIKLSTARAMVAQGRLPVCRVGRRIFVREETIQKIINDGLK
jgi:hypothetical protein